MRKIKEITSLETRLIELYRHKVGIEKEMGIEICFKFIPSERIKGDELEDIDVDGLIRNMNDGTMGDIDFECLEHLKARYSQLLENHEVKQAFGDLFYSSPFKLRRRNRG